MEPLWISAMYWSWFWELSSPVLALLMGACERHDWHRVIRRCWLKNRLRCRWAKTPHAITCLSHVNIVLQPDAALLRNVSKEVYCSWWWGGFWNGGCWNKGWKAWRACCCIGTALNQPCAAIGGTCVCCKACTGWWSSTKSSQSTLVVASLTHSGTLTIIICRRIHTNTNALDSQSPFDSCLVFSTRFIGWASWNLWAFHR